MMYSVSAFSSLSSPRVLRRVPAILTYTHNKCCPVLCSLLQRSCAHILQTIMINTTPILNMTSLSSETYAYASKNKQILYDARQYASVKMYLNIWVVLTKRNVYQKDGKAISNYIEWNIRQVSASVNQSTLPIHILFHSSSCVFELSDRPTN